MLFVLAFLLLSSVPSGAASDAELSVFYASDARRRLSLVGLYIMPFAGIAFVWFIVVLPLWISHSHIREDALYSNSQLVTGILFVAMSSRRPRRPQLRPPASSSQAPPPTPMPLVNYPYMAAR